MKLPKEIKPDPLITSIVEIRYKSEFDKLKIFSLISSSLNKFLPEIKSIDNPVQIPPNPFNEYEMSNDDFIFSFGKEIISFKNKSTYKLWDNYFSFIKEIIQALFKENIFKEISRVGIRYISLLENDNFNNVLIEIPAINSLKYEQHFKQFNTLYKKDDLNLNLIIVSNANTKKGDKNLKGTIIDIDSFTEITISKPDDVLKKIELLHTEEKIMFFNLLKPEFVESLNPSY